MNVDKIFWTDFLEIYKESPCLWKIKSSEYSNRVIKAEAYQKLIDKLKEKFPDANRDMVVKKINTYRTTYRKELKKVKMSEKSGAGSDDIYEPTLWYYNLLSFLEDQEDRSPSTCTMENDFQEETSPIASPLIRQKKKRMTDEDNLIKIACEHLQSQNMANTDNNDADDTLAKAWRAQLKEMEPEQKFLARKLISDVIFQGSIGNLNRHHIQELPNFFNSRPNSSSSSLPSQSTVNFTDTPQHFVQNNNMQRSTSDSQLSQLIFTDTPQRLIQNNNMQPSSSDSQLSISSYFSNFE